MWCFRHHRAYYSWKSELGPLEHGLGTWLLCGAVRSELARDLLMAAGFLVADSDGGLLYWRLAFWRPSLFRSSALAALRAGRS